MTEDKEGSDPSCDTGGSKTFMNKNKDKKPRLQKPLTKIIIRRLPPTMSEASFLEQVSPIPEHDYFYFAKPDLSLGNNVFSRAYINFLNIEDIFLFRDKFDGYVFLDDKGVEYVGIVEYAPFQRIPKRKKKKDPKCGTIESDPVYQEFVEFLSKDPETENQPKLEYSYPMINDGNHKKVQSTPLLEYLAARKQDKRGRDERRRRENDKRKMRVERKVKEAPIKKSEDEDDDEKAVDAQRVNSKSDQNKYWFGEQRVYHKSKVKYSRSRSDTKALHSSNEQLNSESHWDNNFPALSAKMHSTFTLSSAKYCDEKVVVDVNKKSGGDTHSKEDEAEETEYKKIRPRDWDKDKTSSKYKDDNKESTFESKTFKDHRKSTSIVDRKKKVDADKKDELIDEGNKKDITKESARDQKSKKYSDSRKERSKPESVKSDKVSKPETKSKLPNHNDIKPFTQLPQVKTDDLAKIIDSMDRKMKLEEKNKKANVNDAKSTPAFSNNRRNSVDSGERSSNEESQLGRQNSLEDRGKSTDREGSEEKEKSESAERRRSDRRIRNKDRPSMVIYQPGMGRFSKQRLAKDKDCPSSNAEDKDT